MMDWLGEIEERAARAQFWASDDDAEFAVFVREDIPRLCARLRAVEALAEEAEHEVEYCNPAVVRVDALRRTLKGEA